MSNKNDKKSGKIAIVTGASSGIGKSEKARLEEVGFKVYNFSRHNYDGGTNFISVDVTDREAVFAAFKEVYENEKRIDLLVNNAGFGIAGAIETTPEQLMKSQFEVNFFGTVNCTQAAVPFMRECEGGRIINTSSVASVYPIPFQAFYSCTKAAINAFTSALNNEVKMYGISACAVMPGDIKSNFGNNRVKTDTNELYPMQEKSIGVMEKDEFNGMSPDCVAKLVTKLALKKRVNPLYTVGVKYKFLVFISRFFSHKFCDKVVGGMYVKDK